MGNVISSLADRAVADRHETYAGEIRALLDAALVVMQRDDTIAPKVIDIVRECGLSNQAFYRHFGGKDALLVALLADGRERLARTVARRMDRAESNLTRLHAWVGAVLDQARDAKAAAATRPFVANSERLAITFPTEVARSRDELVGLLDAIVDHSDAVAVYHLTMGAMHEAVAVRRTLTKHDVEMIAGFAARGCGL